MENAFNPAAPLADFAASVHATCRKIGSSSLERFGARKVFVAAIADALGVTGGQIDRFKQRLLEANRERLLDLARADLVAAMNPVAVAASEISDLGATFHFVVDPSAREPWERAS